VFVTTTLADGHSASDQTYVFPLYTYNVDGGVDANLSAEIVGKIAERILLPSAVCNLPSPIDVFDYVYGVLHDPKYREKYQEFLKIDYPRIPYPKDKATFDRYIGIGSRLRRLHLLEDVPELQTTFPIADGNVVENVRYVDGKVLINKTQYFGNVPFSVWNFYIGGYQPAQKYLKDRKGRVLSFEEIHHYQKIVAVQKETIKLMEEVDTPNR
jgi:predicted helicase